MTESVLIRDLSTQRSRLRLVGKDAKRFLHGMVTNDVTGLQPGQGCHAAMLTVKGKLLSDLGIYDLGDEGLLLELPGTTGENIRGTLDRYLISDDATVSDASAEIAELGVYGSGSVEALQQIVGSSSELASLAPYHFIATTALVGSVRIARTPELGIVGFHVFGAPQVVQVVQSLLESRGAAVLSEDAARVLRVEAGMPLYGVDIDEERMPNEARLEDVFSPTKGCYLGQEVVVRLRDRGQVNRMLIGLHLPGLPSEQELPKAGTKLAHASRPHAGQLTSIVRSPTEGVIALGYAHRSVWDPGTELQLVNDAGEPTGQTAVVTALPFTRTQGSKR